MSEEYSYAGVLNFLDKEFRKFQDKQEAWELEKSELKSEISTLKEKNLKHEHIQIDLLKRIKMLEFSLRNERNKQKVEDDSISLSLRATSKFTQNQLKPVALPQTFQSKTPVASETLRKYLQELSCSEVWSLISKPSNVVAQSLGVTQLTDIDSTFSKLQLTPKTNQQQPDIQISKPGDSDRMEEEDFGATVKISSMNKNPTKELTDEDWEAMSDEELTKRASEKFKISDLEGLLGTGKKDKKNKEKHTSKHFSMDELGEMGSMKITDQSKNLEDNAVKITKSHDPWKTKYTLLSHFMGVRSLNFHPKQSILLSGSEDGTMKLWDLKKKRSSDNEPIHTFRGHIGGVYSVLFLDEKEVVSAGDDGEIKIWDLPSFSQKVYKTHGIAVPYLKGNLKGHKNSIWSLSTNFNSKKLLSASSDQTVKLWDFEDMKDLKTFNLDNIPTFVSHFDSSKFLYSDISSNLILKDIESEKTIWNVNSNKNDNSLIYQFIQHPTLPLIISAHDNKMIKFWDSNTGKLVHELVGHKDSVTCLSMDPNGSVFLSGSHDNSIRMWDISTKNCIQDISSAHRKKFDESVLSMSHHSNTSYFASGGADSIIKVYQ